MWVTRRSRHPAWTEIISCPNRLRTFYKHAPEPVSHVCQEEWLEYQMERQRLSEERRLARKKREEDRETLEQQQRKRRDTATARPASHGLPLLNITRHCLKEQKRGKKRRYGTSWFSQNRRNGSLTSSTGWVSAMSISPISGFSATIWFLTRRSGNSSFQNRHSDLIPYTAYAAIALYMRCVGSQFSVSTGTGVLFSEGTVISGLASGLLKGGIHFFDKLGLPLLRMILN